MDEQEVFAFLKKQKKAVLLEFLQAAFQEMTAKQQRNVFADAVRQSSSTKIDGALLRQEIETFHRDSLAQRYYAPFAVNSKNYMDIPEETMEWCDLCARFVADATRLTAQGKHEAAVACFGMLNELLEAVESGEDIIFAKEAGSWMIPTDMKEWMKAYLTSLAAVSTPEGFTAAALPLIKRDSHHSFVDQVFASAMKVANPQQKVHLQAESKNQKIRRGGTS